METLVPEPMHFLRLADYLKHVRESKLMSLTDIVRASEKNAMGRLKVSLPLLSRIESGRVADPHFSTVLRLAHAYGVSLEEIAFFF